MEEVESLFLSGIVDRILAMPLSVNGGEDRRVWRFTKNGMFIVKSAYHIAVEKYPQANLHHPSPSTTPNSWKKIWMVRTILRVQNFLWKACINAMPTTTNLVRRHCMEDATCGMCGEEAETVKHATLHCNKIAPIWYTSSLCLDIKQHHGRSFKELLWETMDNQPPEVTSLVAFTVWEIWNARNKLYFEDKKINLIFVIHRARSNFNEYTSWRKKEKLLPIQSTMQKRWTKLVRGKLKCNCDVAVKDNGNVGVGFVVRYHDGNIQLAGKDEMKVDSSTTLLEGLAMRYALQMISQYNISVDWVESDSLSLVESIRGRMKLEVYVDIVIQDIRRLATCVENPNIKYIPRQANKVAHQLPHGPSLTSIKHIPDHVRSFVNLDVMVT